MKTSHIISIVGLCLAGLATILMFTKYKQFANIAIFAAVVCLGVAQLLKEESYLGSHMMNATPASSALCWNQKGEKVDPATVSGGCTPICVKGTPNDPCCPSDYNDALWDGITCNGVKGEDPNWDFSDPAKLGQACDGPNGAKGYVCTLVNSHDVKCPTPDPPDCPDGFDWDTSINPPCGGWKCSPPPPSPPNCGESPGAPNCVCPPCSSLSGDHLPWLLSGCDISCGASVTKDDVKTCCHD